MGCAEGLFVGADDVGDSVGASVGESLGCFVGPTVGASLGFFVGENVGAGLLQTHVWTNGVVYSVVAKGQLKPLHVTPASLPHVKVL